MPRDEAPPFGIGAPLPPANLDAEMGLLGGLLARNDELHRIGAVLDAEAFYDPANGKLFTLIAEEIRAGRRCDAVTLKVRLQNSGMLDEVGGTAYLSKLLASMVAPGLTPEYASAVRDAWLRRRLAEAAADLHHLAHGADPEKDGEAVLSETLASLSGLAAASGSALHGVMSIGDAARRAIEGYEAVHRGDPSPALLSGFAPVDNALGGFMPGHLVILGGRSRMGKTALAQQLSEGVAGRLAASGGYVLMFSQEMPSVELGGRAVAAATGFDANTLGRGEFGLHTAEGLIAAQKHLDGVPLLICDTSGLTADELVLTTQSLKARYPIRLVVIDHLQKMRLGKNADRLGTAYAIGQTTSALKDAAKRLNVAVLLLAQLGREVDRRPDPRPMLSDLAYAGEADADTVALLWRPELYHPASAPEHSGKETEESWSKRVDAWNRRRDEIRGKAEVVIAKRRGGSESTVTLAFSGATSSFSVPGIQYGNQPDDRGQWWEDAAQ